MNERPNVEERYTSAGNATDLTVDAERGGAADVIIAAGWSPSRLGAALLRLHSEWDASEKPKKMTKEAIEGLALTLPRIEQGRKMVKGEAVVNMVVDMRRANQMAHDWHLHELRLLLGKLKTLPAIRYQIALQADQWGMADAQDKAAAVIRYWLDQACGSCHGRKFRLIPGTPALSDRPCLVCHGSGIGHAPYGQDGRKLVNFIDDCVSRARQSIKKRLRPAANM